MKIRLTKAQKIKLANSQQVYEIMKDVLRRETYLDLSKEHFWIVCLAHNNMLLLIELVSFGSRTATVVEPTEVFSFALQKKAGKLIMVHNHPSGTLEPSHADKVLTERMGAIGKFVKVPVIDHLIITEESYYSFADSGLLWQIMDDTRYDLSFNQIDRFKYEMKMAEKKAERQLKKALEEKEGAEKKGEQKEKIRTAIAMKKNKMTVTQIAAITGLSAAEIKRI